MASFPNISAESCAALIRALIAARVFDLAHDLKNGRGLDADLFADTVAWLGELSDAPDDVLAISLLRLIEHRAAKSGRGVNPHDALQSG